MSSRGLNQLGSNAQDFDMKGGFSDLLDGVSVEKIFFDRDNSMSLVKLPIEERNWSSHLVNLDLVFELFSVYLYALKWSLQRLFVCSTLRRLQRRH